MIRSVLVLALAVPVLAIPQVVHSGYRGGASYEYRSDQWLGWSEGRTDYDIGGRRFTGMYKNDGDTYWFAKRYEKPNISEVEHQVRSKYKVSCFWRQIETSREWVKEGDMEPGGFFRWLLNHHCD